MAAKTPYGHVIPFAYMKKALLFLLAAAVLAGLMLLIFVKVLAPAPSVPSVPGDPFKVDSNPPQNVSDDAGEFVQSAFRWYLGESSNDYRYPLTEAFRTERVEWFSQDFIDRWDTTSAENESDPLYGAQDIPLSWATSIQVSVIEKSADKAVVLVTLGSGIDLTKRRITLVRNSEGEWRIDSAESPN